MMDTILISLVHAPLSSFFAVLGAAQFMTSSSRFDEVSPCSLTRGVNVGAHSVQVYGITNIQAWAFAVTMAFFIVDGVLLLLCVCDAPVPR
jgi:hypothetical protein